MYKLLCTLALALPLTLGSTAPQAGLMGAGGTGSSSSSSFKSSSGLAVGTHGARSATELVEKMRSALPLRLNEHLSLRNISNDDRSNYIFHFYSNTGQLTNEVCKEIKSSLKKNRSTKKFRDLFEEEDGSVAFKYTAPNHQVCFVDL